MRAIAYMARVFGVLPSTLIHTTYQDFLFNLECARLLNEEDGNTGNVYLGGFG